jgi:hypothetical protein
MISLVFLLKLFFFSGEADETGLADETDDGGREGGYGASHW